MTVRTGSAEAASLVASLPGRAAIAPRSALDPITTSAVRTWCDAMGDRTWSDGVAGVPTIVPPATLQLWTFPPVSPDRADDGPSLPGDFDTTLRNRLAELGYTATLATAAEYDFRQAIELGMTLTVAEHYVDSSPEKQTSIGRGFFVTSLAEFCSERHGVIGCLRSTVFHFAPVAAGVLPEPYRPISPRRLRTHGTQSAVTPGAVFGAVEVPLTPTQVIAGALATRDIYPVHHDRDFARAHGSRDVVLSIPTTCGLLARIIGEWTGNKRLVMLDIRLRASAFANQLLTVEGHVDRRDDHTAELTITARTDDGVHAEAAARVHVGEQDVGRPTTNQTRRHQ